MAFEILNHNFPNRTARRERRASRLRGHAIAGTALKRHQLSFGEGTSDAEKPRPCRRDARSLMAPDLVADQIFKDHKLMAI